MRSILHQRKQLGLIFLVGLLVRLLLMPFAMHADFLSMSWRAHLMATFNQWGLGHSQWLGHFIYALNFKWLKWAGFNFEHFFAPEFGLQPGSQTASVGSWLLFNHTPGVNQALFLWKLPHLFFDGAIFYLLARFFRQHPNHKLIVASWWLNPVNLYVFYVFSRHDVMAYFFVLLAIMWFARNKMVQIFVSLFLAVKTRVQPLMLVPFFLVGVVKRNSFQWRKLISQLALAAGVVLISGWGIKQLPVNREVLNQQTHYQPPANVQASDQTNTQTNTQTNAPTNIQANAPTQAEEKPHNLGSQLINKVSSVIGFNLASRFGRQTVGGQIWGVPLFAVFYIGLLVFHIQVHNPRKTEPARFSSAQDRSPKNSTNTLIMVLYITLASYFIVNPFSPHYFVWLSLFLTLMLAQNNKLIYSYALAVIAWAVFSASQTDSTMFSPNLFLPLSTNFFYLPPVVDSQLVNQVSKIVFNLSLIISIFQAVKLDPLKTIKSVKNKATRLKIKTNKSAEK